MNATMDVATSTSGREIVIERLIHAPRALVFQMFTDPQHVGNWWGPKGFTTTIHKMEVQPGGEWNLIMHGPDGTDYKNKIVYQEIVPAERLAYEHVSGPKFNAIITFEGTGGKTQLTMRMIFGTAEERERVVEQFGAIEGGKQTFDRLETYVAEQIDAKKNRLELTTPSDTEIVMKRVLNAPRHLVFEACTKPEHISQWWGCTPLAVCDIDFRVGGKYRFVMRMQDGTEHIFCGEYREIVPPEKFVYTFIYEPYPNDGALVTLALEEHNGQTTMIETMVHGTREARDGHLNAGMEAGAAESLDRLQALLDTMS